VKKKTVRKRPARKSEATAVARKKRAVKAKPMAARSRVSSALMTARMIEAPDPYLEITMRGPVTEESMVRFFERSRSEVMRQRPKRVLVDLRNASVMLTISDMNALAKMVAGAFVGVIDRLAMTLRREDMPEEKFFEPSVNRRGLPTLVTTDIDDAIYWLAAKLRPTR
jgi:hypothetical protein